MRALIVAEFITLDGVIQAPGGVNEDTEGGFAHGGWTLPYWHDDIGKRFSQAMSRADALLLGRKTWQIHGGAFEPMVNDPFGDAMNSGRAQQHRERQEVTVQDHNHCEQRASGIV